LDRRRSCMFASGKRAPLEGHIAPTDIESSPPLLLE
jgi:hypothetical protein